MQENNLGASVLEMLSQHQANIYTNIPARVISWNGKEQLADVELVVKRPYPNGQADEAIKVIDVPVMFMNGGSWTIAGELKKGDTVLLVCPMFNIESWLVGEKGKTYAPNNYTLHNLDGAFALTGCFNYDNPTRDSRFIDKFHIVKGKNYLVMDDTSVVIEANGGASRIEMLSDGSLNITTSGTSTITSSDTVINNNTTINGNLTVNGNTDSTGTVTGQSGMFAPTYSGYGGAGTMTIGTATINSATIGGIGFSSHVHLDAESRPTGTPQ